MDEADQEKTRFYSLQLICLAKLCIIIVVFAIFETYQTIQHSGVSTRLITFESFYCVRGYGFIYTLIRFLSLYTQRVRFRYLWFLVLLDHCSRDDDRWAIIHLHVSRCLSSGFSYQFISIQKMNVSRVQGWYSNFQKWIKLL